MRSASSLYHTYCPVYQHRRYISFWSEDHPDLISAFLWAFFLLAYQSHSDSVRFWNLLYTKDWNYQGKGSAFHREEYLSEELMDCVIRIVSEKIREEMVMMEDPSVVALHVMAAVMVRRCMDGLSLPEDREEEAKGGGEAEGPSEGSAEESSRRTADAICDALEEQFSIPLGLSERKAIRSHIASTRLRDASLLSFESAPASSIRRSSASAAAFWKSSGTALWWI